MYFKALLKKEEFSIYPYLTRENTHLRLPQALTIAEKNQHEYLLNPVTGVARENSFLTGTRGFMLVLVIVVAGMVMINTLRQLKWWFLALASLFLAMITLWPNLEPVRMALADKDHNLIPAEVLAYIPDFMQVHVTWEKVAGWCAVIFMLPFFIYGQRAKGKQLLHNFREGHFNREGFWAQVSRLLTFGSQTVYFGVKGDIDIAIANGIGAAGSAYIIFGHIKRFLFGQPTPAASPIPA